MLSGVAHRSALRPESGDGFRQHPRCRRVQHPRRRQDPETLVAVHRPRVPSAAGHHGDALRRSPRRQRTDASDRLPQSPRRPFHLRYQQRCRLGCGLGDAPVRRRALRRLPPDRWLCRHPDRRLHRCDGCHGTHLLFLHAGA